MIVEQNNENINNRVVTDWYLLIVFICV